MSFEEYFEQHFARLVALGESMADDRDAARELAQETFVRLHHHWATVREYDNPGGWLRQVMFNLSTLVTRTARFGTRHREQVHSVAQRRSPHASQ